VVSARSDVHAPSPRFGHVAVWTGSSLLVWGGADETQRRYGDGGQYDPWEDRWTPIEGPEIPGAGARESAVGVWTGAELIVVGGTDGGSQLTQLGWRYQP
jgi:hypothetical protein